MAIRPWSDKGIHYKTGAPYFRIGMDYNALYNKKHGNMILVGPALCGNEL